MRKRIGVIFQYAFLCLMAAVVLVPLLYVILTSLTPLEDIGASLFFPEKLSLRNFSTVLFETDFLRYMLNTLYVGIVVVLVSQFFNSLAAYAFARIQFPGSKLMFSLLITTLIIPGEVLIVPQYMLVSRLGWIDSYWALIVPSMASAFYTFFLRQFFIDLPRELEDSATLDGCSRFKTYRSIMLPLIKAPLLTVALLTFFNVWDSFLWPLTVINTPKKFMIQIAISVLNTETFTDVGAQFANVVLSSLPIVLIFIWLQKYYVAGISTGAVKG